MASQIAYLQKGNLNVEGALKAERKFSKKIDAINIEEKVHYSLQCEDWHCLLYPLTAT